MILDILRKFILPKIAGFLYFIYFKTLRINIVTPREFIDAKTNLPIKFHQPLIYAHWHGDELVLLGWYAFRHMVALVSHSKDGDIMSGALKTLGYEVIRGSSSRGGASGLFGFIKAIKKNNYISGMAVDGPKGPRHIVKPGVIKVASALQLPIYPLGAMAPKRKVFEKSWNKTYVARPFSKIYIKVGEPINVPIK